MDDLLVKRLRLWGIDGVQGGRADIAIAADRIEAQAAEIRSLRAQVEERSAWAAAQVKDALEVGRAQVAQERAGIVAWLRGTPHANWQAIADIIERHEDKEPRA
jgi:phage host-nuclease inhibitor protein Gam